MSKATDKQDAALFQIALAKLAGLDPSMVVTGSVDVSIEREAGGTVARLTAGVACEVDPDEVVRLAMKYNRPTATAEVPAVP